MPDMGDSEVMTAASIARIPCPASITCGDAPKILAYPLDVGSRKTPVTGSERAIGARIREARERLGVSIAELGAAWGGSRQKVQFWERGDHFPPLSDFRRLCELLRTDANQILGMSAVKPLDDTDVLSARMQIQTMAQAAKNEIAVRRKKVQERLQRRPARA